MSEFDKQLMDSFRSLYDLEVRTDERVKNLIIRCDATDEKYSETLQTQKDIEGRVRVLESKTEEFGSVAEQVKLNTASLADRVKTVELSKNNSDDRWKTIVNFCVQLSLILVAAYLLYKLGLQAPAVP
jgi:hypothetical protein